MSEHYRFWLAVLIIGVIVLLALHAGRESSIVGYAVTGFLGILGGLGLGSLVKGKDKDDG